LLDLQKKYLYSAYGLKIKSDISMKELISLKSSFNNEVDVEVKVSDLSEKWKEYGEKGKFIVKDKFVIFQVENTGIFYVEDGTTIIFSPSKGVSLGKVKLFILGSCMGIILLQRKILPLHGSVIEINGKAYAIVGDSGAGKSTLASAFIKQGYRLLSDDVIPVNISSKGKPIVNPSYPQQKLWKESLDKFNMNDKEFLPLFERETKYAIPVTEDFCNNPLPLAGIIELVSTNCKAIEFRLIEKLERFHLLYRQTFRNILIPRMDLVKWHFGISASIIENTCIYQITRPKTELTLNEIVELVLNLIIEEENKC